MTISQYATNNTGGSPFTFFGITAHSTLDTEPWEFQDTQEVFYGVQGMQETRDKVHGRILTLSIDMFGYASESLLRADLNTLASYTNNLAGPLSISGMTYNNVVFKGYQQTSKIQYFSGTTPGWGTLGVILTWRQLKP